MQYRPSTQEYSQDVARQDSQRVLRNTYLLLSMTLLFSAVTAGISMAMGIRHINILLFILGTYGSMFWVYKTSDSAMGLVATFVFTGFMGFTLGPILSGVASLPGGSQTIVTALAMTGFAFAGLSAIAIVTRKDFNFLSSFIMVGALVLIAAMVISLFLPTPGFVMAISAGFVLLASATILFKTSQLVRGEEMNYIEATISLYVSLYNMFVSLLNLLSMSSRD